MIPNFEASGFLPAGLHKATWSEFAERFGAGVQRERLNDGLHHILTLLSQAGCEEVRIGGSFVTDNEYPRDFDGVWMEAAVNVNKLPMELHMSVRAQPDIFGGMLVPDSFAYTDIGRMLMAIEINRAGDRVGVVVVDPRTVPMCTPMPRYEHFYASE